MIRVVILGSKEYPFGSNRGDDPIPSGGMETYVNDLAPELSKLCRPPTKEPWSCGATILLGWSMVKLV